MDAIGQLIARFFDFVTAPVRWLASVPTWFVSTPRKLLGLSLPARVAWLVWFLLVACTVTAVLVIWWNEQAAAISHYVLDIKFGVVVGLTVVIPIVVYFWLRAWLQGNVSRFPDIDEAWQEGLAALARSKVDLASVPAFLVLGAQNENAADAVFAASSLEFHVREVPHGRAPLRWFADEKGIYVVCLDCSRLSKLHGTGGERREVGGAGRDPTATLQPGPVGIRGTLVSAPVGRETAVAGVGVAGDEPPAGAGDGVRGTLMPGAARGTLVAGAGSSGRMAAPASGGLSRPAAEEQTERLRYVCELLHRARDPVCPLNGVLVLLPFECLQNVMVAKDMPAAIKSDLQAIRDATRLLCPITTLVTGMERDSGFCELVRRVGVTQSREHRFGKGYEVGNSPTAENLDAFTSHACGAFEDWVYNLFREQDGLTKPGNDRLYAMLCRIRSHVLDRLRNVLVHGFGFDPSDKRAADKPPLFNGCYFAATGAGAAPRAFVKSVFQKMVEMEEEVEWTDEAIDEDNRCQNLARAGMMFDGLLALSLVAMIVFYFVFRQK